MDETLPPAEQKADLILQKVTNLKGRDIQVVQDLVFIHSLTGNEDDDLAYTVIRNKALSNNSFMFGEERGPRGQLPQLVCSGAHRATGNLLDGISQNQGPGELVQFLSPIRGAENQPGLLDRIRLALSKILERRTRGSRPVRYVPIQSHRYAKFKW